ncbi:MAG: class I SAM-dependent methyltransferase family protein, partial [Nanoarchaeota archaeon]|nr:class I SAM-dependent methyltransferase family protein [Nanoarchaeota archaeon]
MANYDVVGNIVIVKFSWDEKLKDKKRWAEKFLKEHKQIRTILEKSEKFSRRLRTQSTKFIAGEKTKEVLYKENGCLFRFNVDTCYFSPRLSSERKELASKVRKGEKVLVMFGGVAPFAIVIGKLSRAGKIVSVEL